MSDTTKTEGNDGGDNGDKGKELPAAVPAATVPETGAPAEVAAETAAEAATAEPEAKPKRSKSKRPSIDLNALPVRKSPITEAESKAMAQSARDSLAAGTPVPPRPDARNMITLALAKVAEGVTVATPEDVANFIADPARCRALVGAIEGANVITDDGPVALERYRKRAEKLLNSYVKAGALQSEPKRKPGGNTAQSTVDNGASTGASSAMTSDAEVAAGGHPQGGEAAQSQETTMAKAVLQPSTKSKGKATKAKTKTAPKPKADKGPGVIDSIVEFLKAGGGTVEQIVAKLAKRFPDRDADGLTATTKIQMTRLEKPKGEGGRGLKIKREKVEGSNALVYSAK